MGTKVLWVVQKKSVTFRTKRLFDENVATTNLIKHLT